MATEQSSFRLLFQAQVDYLQQKVRLPTESYKDLESFQHDRAFVAAGAMKADLLNDLQGAIVSAAKDGIGLKAFQDNFDDLIGKHGWLQDEDKGYTAWRAKIIYKTNMSASHAAGRYKQQTDPEMLKTRPYLIYRHNTIENPRQQHVKLNGLVLRADDPFWKIYYPPNGYGCNCTVDSLNERQLKALGKDGPDEAPSFEIDNKGFDSAPGATWQPDLNKYPHSVAKDYVAENMQDGVFDRWLDRIADQVKTDLKDNASAYQSIKSIKGYGAQDVATKELLRKRLGTTEQYPVAVLNPDQQQLLGVKTQVVNFSNYDAVKQAFSRDGNTGFDHAAYGKLQGLIDNALAIIRQTGDGSTMSVWIEIEKGKNYVAVLQQTKSGKGLFLKSYRVAGLNEVERAKKRGDVLYERKD